MRSCRSCESTSLLTIWRLKIDKKSIFAKTAAIFRPCVLKKINSWRTNLYTSGGDYRDQCGNKLFYVELRPQKQTKKIASKNINFWLRQRHFQGYPETQNLTILQACENMSLKSQKYKGHVDVRFSSVFQRLFPKPLWLYLIISASFYPQTFIQTFLEIARSYLYAQ